jgi:putative ABC transport system permease protein
MNFLIILKVALRSLRRTLLRSGLTALGIIVGVAAVIAMVSIGNGARMQVEKALANVDTTTINLHSVPPRKTWRAGVPMQLAPGDGLTLEDAEALKQELAGLATVDVMVSAGNAGEIKANGRRSGARVQGTGAPGIKTTGYQIVQGSAFGQSDVDAAASVCLISQHIATTLFDHASPIGRQVRVGAISFVVIGVLGDKSSLQIAMGGQGDTTVLVPYTTVLRRFDSRAAVVISLKAGDPQDVALIQQRALDLLERRRGKRKAEFMSGNAASMVEAYKEGSKTMTVLNIMLVSVTERTREIGIRLAIGTRGRDVLRQFLIESTVLSVIGGAIGILVGVGAAKLMTYMNNWPTSVTVSSIVAAFLCSAAIGVFFGYYPARQAARLDPIQALRAE